jgi:hypothetical protein
LGSIDQLTTIVPFIWVGWIEQWKGYVPATVKVRPSLLLGAMVGVVHVPSSSVAEWGVPLVLLKVITSPTLAVIDAGLNAKSTTETATVPAVVVSEQGPAALEAAVDGAAAPLDGAVDPLLDEQPASTMRALTARAVSERWDIRSSLSRMPRVLGLCAGYVPAAASVSTRLSFPP